MKILFHFCLLNFQTNYEKMLFPKMSAVKQPILGIWAIVQNYHLLYTWISYWTHSLIVYVYIPAYIESTIPLKFLNYDTCDRFLAIFHFYPFISKFLASSAKKSTCAHTWLKCFDQSTAVEINPEEIKRFRIEAKCFI